MDDDLSAARGLGCALVNVAQFDLGQGVLHLEMTGGRKVCLSADTCGTAEAITRWEKLRAAGRGNDPQLLNVAAKLLELVFVPESVAEGEVLRFEFM